MHHLQRLKSLIIESCLDLTDFRGVHNLAALESLKIQTSFRPSLEFSVYKLPDMRSLRELKSLEFESDAESWRSGSWNRILTLERF